MDRRYCSLRQEYIPHVLAASDSVMRLWGQRFQEVPVQ